jgi:hypothetical protein
MRRPVANGKEAREIYKIGTFYKDADETLAKNGFAPQGWTKGVPAARLNLKMAVPA